MGAEIRTPFWHCPKEGVAKKARGGCGVLELHHASPYGLDGTLYFLAAKEKRVKRLCFDGWNVEQRRVREWPRFFAVGCVIVGKPLQIAVSFYPLGQSREVLAHLFQEGNQLKPRGLVRERRVVPHGEQPRRVPSKHKSFEVERVFLQAAPGKVLPVP